MLSHRVTVLILDFFSSLEMNIKLVSGVNYAAWFIFYTPVWSVQIIQIIYINVESIHQCSLRLNWYLPGRSSRSISNLRQPYIQYILSTAYRADHAALDPTTNIPAWDVLPSGLWLLWLHAEQPFYSNWSRGCNVISTEGDVTVMGHGASGPH